MQMHLRVLQHKPVMRLQLHLLYVLLVFVAWATHTSAQSTCTIGYTGPDGGPCVACVAGTYKSTTGSAACTSCAVGTYLSTIGATTCTNCGVGNFCNTTAATTTSTCSANSGDSCVTCVTADCPCNAGYTGGNFISPYSTTACARFLALTLMPTLLQVEYVSTRLSPYTGKIAYNPTYNPTGGPNGKGHVSFNRALTQFLTESTKRTFNIATNGGFSLVAVVRFTGTAGARESIFSLGDCCQINGVNPKWPNFPNNIILSRDDLLPDFAVLASSSVVSIDDSTRFNQAGTLVQNAWFTVEFKYIASENRRSYLRVNGVDVSIVTGIPNAMTDMTGQIYVGIPAVTGSQYSYFNGDIAGLFFVDEYLTNEATTAIAAEMTRGLDLTDTICLSNTCTACAVGKYKSTSGTASCTNCDACTGSTSPVGSTSQADCIVAPGCNAGYTGPIDGPCVACVVGTYKSCTGSAACTDCAAGKYSTTVGATAAATCLACPSNSNSPSTSSALAACTCNVGFSGPDGSGPCTACVVGKYKSLTGSAACTNCGAGTYSAATGASAVATCLACYANSGASCSGCSAYECPCNAGYIITINFVVQYSSTVCARFVALMTWKPSFASVSTRNNAAVGSKALPKYNALGGPNGNGHVSFDRALLNYLDAGPRTFNAATNGGFTIVIVLRFSGTSVKTETILELPPTRVWIYAGGSRSSIRVYLSTGTQVTATFSSGTNWFYIVCTYSSVTNVINMLINNVNMGSLTSPYFPDVTLSKMLIGTFDGLSSQFTGDIAGLFVVDELLSSSAIDEIYNKMLQGVDLTYPSCSASCVACVAGKYQIDASSTVCTNCASGKYSPTVASAACTDCAAGTYSAATGATAAATCTACPAGLTSPVGSTSSVACILPGCNAGYTGPSGDTCTACVAGKYKTATGSAACTDCAAGTYLTTTGATAAATCGACPGNSNSPISSSALAACTCVAGTYGNAAIPESCTDSPNVIIETENHDYYCWELGGNTDISNCVYLGLCQTCCARCASYCGTPMTITCIACPAGKYKTATGNEACTHCGAGKYSTTVGATGSAVCTDCGAGMYSTATGATAAATCVSCPAGQTSPTGSTSSTACYTPCEAGTYPNTALPASCTDSQSAVIETENYDYYCWNVIQGRGASACVNEGLCQSCCLTCASYCGTPMTTTCIACPAGTTSPIGSTSSAACVSTCNLGFTGPDGGTCTACAAGKYKTATGSAACLTCPANANSPAGSTAAASCACNVGFVLSNNTCVCDLGYEPGV